MRGEFIRGDGLVIPNNVTPFGARMILRMAFRDEYIGLAIGLCNGVFSPDLRATQLDEPTIGVGGYGRRIINPGAGNWPTVAAVNGQQYVECVGLEFSAAAPGYDKSIQRLFLCTDGAAPEAEVFSLSGPLPTPLRITPATPAADRTFRYRLYLG